MPLGVRNKVGTAMWMAITDDYFCQLNANHTSPNNTTCHYKVAARHLQRHANGNT